MNSSNIDKKWNEIKDWLNSEDNKKNIEKLSKLEHRELCEIICTLTEKIKLLDLQFNEKIDEITEEFTHIQSNFKIVRHNTNTCMDSLQRHNLLYTYS